MKILKGFTFSTRPRLCLMKNLSNRSYSLFEKKEERLRERQSLETKELLIDNNLAERTIRKLTTQRNNSLHYGSDAGAEMAATYHSVIGTVKLHGSSIWNFIGTFFKNIFNGCRDYVNMIPDKLTLATGQC